MAHGRTKIFYCKRYQNKTCDRHSDRRKRCKSHVDGGGHLKSRLLWLVAGPGWKTNENLWPESTEISISWEMEMAGKEFR